MVKVIFVQPFLVSSKLAEQCEGRTIVLDVAFNAGSPAGRGTPQEQYNNTTKAFIDALGNKLVLWLDHHDHVNHVDYASDPRFVFVPRAEAPACPPLITVELMTRIGEVDTIVAHGDLDGIYSAVKAALGGKGSYPEFDSDSIAADSRVGTMSHIGQRYENALKSNLSDDSIRHAVFTELSWNYGDSQDILQQATNAIEDALARYSAIQAETKRLAALFVIDQKVAFVDATETTAAYDLTQLLLAGQKLSQVAVVRNIQRDNPQITVAGPREWNFIKIFNLSGGMPNRVNLPDQDVQSVIETINQAQ